MATERQRAANRANAAKSTGPRSPGGKARASRNAYRHGLSARIYSESDCSAELEKLMREIVDSADGQICAANAREIAEAELDLRRVRSAVLAQDQGQVPSGARAQSASPPPAVGSLEAEPARTENAVNSAVVLLRKLDRYHHRATARRIRAIRRALRVTLMHEIQDR
jgi:hypothetical protein